jgi:hypothetical protein
MTEIICRICKCPKQREDFYNSKNKSGHETTCKQCSNLQHYERRRERRLEKGLLIKFPTLAGRQIAEEGKKYCPTCKQILDLSEFSTMKVRDGIASHCRECSNRYRQEKRNTSEGKQKRKADYQRDKEKLLDRKLRRKFGISLKEYQVRLDGQGNKCIICGRTPEENGKMLAVDHNHTTGVIRDLLCNNCNACLGFIEKSYIDLDRLKWYLTKHNTQKKEEAIVVPPHPTTL